MTHIQPIMNSYSKRYRPIMPTLPIMPGVENTVIKQFQLYQEKSSTNLEANLYENNDISRGILYTKKQKLAVISYATTI